MEIRSIDLNWENLLGDEREYLLYKCKGDSSVPFIYKMKTITFILFISILRENPEAWGYDYNIDII